MMGHGFNHGLGQCVFSQREAFSIAQEASVRLPCDLLDSFGHKRIEDIKIKPLSQETYPPNCMAVASFVSQWVELNKI